MDPIPDEHCPFCLPKVLSTLTWKWRDHRGPKDGGAPDREYYKDASGNVEALCNLCGYTEFYLPRDMREET